jgi:hypothetical protein
MQRYRRALENTAGRAPIQRDMTPGDLMPSTPDYETIGELYDEIAPA